MTTMKRITMNTIGTTITPEIVLRRLAPEIEVCTFCTFDAFERLTHFVTTRGRVEPANPFSTFNLGRHSGEDLSAVLARRARLCEALAIPPERLVQPRQVHGNEVRIITPEYFTWNTARQGEYLSQADALVTGMTDVCVAISTADCVPLLYYDARRRVVAAAHAGWRGTVGRIASRTVGAMQAACGCDPSDIYAAIGPSIGESAFEVGDEVVADFAAAYPDYRDTVITPRRGAANRHHVDLWAANRLDLLSAGVLPEHIVTAGICTCGRNDLFFSSRRAGGKLFGRFVSGILLR